tara:strand:- start:257 stop:1027 length:771 start_codon:yes stop_codon:yes gene_type:complete
MPTTGLPRSSSDTDLRNLHQISMPIKIREEINSLAVNQINLATFEQNKLVKAIKRSVLNNPALSARDISFLFNQIFDTFKTMMLSLLQDSSDTQTQPPSTDQINDFKASLTLLFNYASETVYEKRPHSTTLCWNRYQMSPLLQNVIKKSEPIRFKKESHPFLKDTHNLFTEEGFNTIKNYDAQKLFYETITTLYQELWFQSNEDGFYVLKDDRDAELRNMLLLFKEFLVRNPLQTSYPTWFDETAYRNIYLIKENR